MESRFACFYLTGQLEWILRKFQLAEVVLVVSKPHVFNLTGQLVSTPPVFPTLAATDLVTHDTHEPSNHDQPHLYNLDGRRDEDAHWRCERDRRE